MLELYTDGSCLKNPGGPVGWAAVLFEDGVELQRFVAGGPSGTNNTAELLAVIEPLEQLPSMRVTVLSDSQYVVRGATEWLPGWKRRDWVSSTGEPVKNRALWERLDAALGRHNVTFQWVRGHVGTPGNELVDQLAGDKAWEFSPTPRPVAKPVSPRRRKKAVSV